MESLLLKVLLVAVQVLISCYWAGQWASANPAIARLEGDFELRYEQFTRRLRAGAEDERLKAVAQLYKSLSRILTTIVVALAAVSALLVYLGLENGIQLFAAIFVIAAVGLVFCYTCLAGITRSTTKSTDPDSYPMLMWLLFFFVAGILVAVLKTHETLVPEWWQAVAGLLIIPAAGFLSVGLFSVVIRLGAPLFAFASIMALSLPLAVSRLAAGIAPNKPFFGLSVVVFALAAIAGALL